MNNHKIHSSHEDNETDAFYQPLIPGIEQMISGLQASLINYSKKNPRAKSVRPIVVELSCTTSRVEQLLNVSFTTLNLIQRPGQIYEKGVWMAKLIEHDSWRVWLKNY
jgi:hypothetical protein